MANEPAAAPVVDKPPAAEPPAKDDSALTGPKPEAQPSAAPQPQALPHAWMGGLTTEQKANADLIKTLSKFPKGIPDMSQAYAELEAKLGKTLTIPNETATPEEWTAFRKTIGIPEKPEDYKLEAGVPKDLQDPQWDKELRTVAHKLNVSQAQLEGMVKWYFAGLKEARVLVKTKAEECHRMLRGELGADYEPAMNYMERAVGKFLNPTLRSLFKQSGLGNHPDMLKMFANIGKAMGEHFFAEGEKGQKTEVPAFGARSEQQIADVLYGNEPPKE